MKKSCIGSLVLTVLLLEPMSVRTLHHTLFFIGFLICMFFHGGFVQWCNF